MLHFILLPVYSLLIPILGAPRRLCSLAGFDTDRSGLILAKCKSIQLMSYERFC